MKKKSFVEINGADSPRLKNNNNSNNINNLNTQNTIKRGGKLPDQIYFDFNNFKKRITLNQPLPLPTLQKQTIKLNIGVERPISGRSDINSFGSANEDADCQALFLSDECLRDSISILGRRDWCTSQLISQFCWNIGNINGRKNFAYINEEFFLDVKADKPVAQVSQATLNKILANNYCFFAVNDSNVHWLGMLVNRSARHVTVYDPLQKFTYIGLAEKLMVYLQKIGVLSAGKYSLELDVNFLAQEDDYSCGIYLCNFIYCIFNNRMDLVFRMKHHVSNFRSQIKKVFGQILEGKPTDFN
ncbi:hypothetical protein DLAC_05966 [Tieghemostelium lacteum]|uniref:Ubiquitin-like protease family profile domain-containing protein n=1 Tax=Tieghemostelium lacteum TaxID=361077 RepID=A0A151ZH45_TIELA|nr:hypothetical protein DLAC_05966 [Tieghemostelium lacteum]|eukprot:KYQ93301.1 hypothetical protein DLAC_05966 [Tieghemostelium lacteum]